jgi:DUF1365 family protein
VESCLYEGTLRHRRFAPPRRDFAYPLFMAYLDLGELDTIFAGRWLWSARGPNAAWFRRADHYGDPETPLDVTIRDLVAERTGSRPAGPIRLLTHLRYWGHCFNPVSFYYCFGKDRRVIDTIVAEVHNTPWGERHMYVLPQADNLGDGRVKRYELEKAFHVSPFLGMDMRYAWQFGSPGERLAVHMVNRQHGERVFDATLSLARRPMTGRELARSLVRYPAMTVKVVAAIYGQALRLWLSGAPFYPHPRTPDAVDPDSWRPGPVAQERGVS